jgi:Holliday junction resolvasome RuvABC endonuclease subunit
MKTFMGLDQSFRSSGIVIIDENEKVVYFEKIQLDDIDQNLDRIDQSYKIAEKIEIIISKFRPEIICLEGLPFGIAGNVTRDLAGLQAVLVTYFRKISKFKSNIIITPPTVIKKLATGKGNSKKEQLFESLPKELQDKFSHQYKKTTGLYDITDGYWLAVYAKRFNVKK